MLEQEFEVTSLKHPVGFFSRSLTGSERIYEGYELEFYTVVRTVNNCCMSLLRREFLLRTDHAALRNLLRLDLPLTNRVEGWILRFSEYNFKIEYKRGQDNVIADVRSKLLIAAAKECGKLSDLDRRSLDHISSTTDPVKLQTPYCTASRDT